MVVYTCFALVVVVFQEGHKMRNTKPVMCAREVNHANFHLLFSFISREHFRHRHKHIAQQQEEVARGIIFSVVNFVFVLEIFRLLRWESEKTRLADKQRKRRLRHPKNSRNLFSSRFGLLAPMRFAFECLSLPRREIDCFFNFFPRRRCRRLRFVFSCGISCGRLSS